MRETQALHFCAFQQALQAFLQSHVAHAWWLEPKTSLDEVAPGAGFASTCVETLSTELPLFDELWVWAEHGAAFHAVLSSSEGYPEVLWQRFDQAPNEASPPKDVRQMSASDRHRFGLKPMACSDAWRLRHHDESGYLWLEPTIGESR